MVPRGPDSSTLDSSGILIRVAGGAASQMQLDSPERADCGGPWVRVPSGGRAALKFREEISGSPCRAETALHFQCLLKSAPGVCCAHRSVSSGLLAHATEVGPSQPPLFWLVRGHRWGEDSLSPGVDSIQVQAEFSLQADLTHLGLHLCSSTVGTCL